jgi:antirestriction protein
MDLQYIVCQVVQDMLIQSKGDQSTNMRSESIDNYSYTLQDNVNLQNLVRSKYCDALAKYKKVIYG